MQDDQTPFESPAEYPADAPPTEAGDFVPVTPPEGWPTVIGVLAIIFGALGIIGAGCGAVMLVAAPALINAMPEGTERDDMEASLQSAMQNVPLQVGVQLIEFVLATVLLVGGIQLIKRSRSAAKTLKIYAVGDLFSNMLVLIVGLIVARAQAAAMAENPDMQQVPQGLQGWIQAAGMIGAVVTWVLTAIWPVFLLLWFRRAKTRESMESWGDGPIDPAYTVR